MLNISRKNGHQAGVRFSYKQTAEQSPPSLFNKHSRLYRRHVHSRPKRLHCRYYPNRRSSQE